MPTEEEKLDIEISGLMDKPIVVPSSLYRRGTEIYKILGCMINASWRLEAIRTQASNQEFDAFSLERPLVWYVVIVRIRTVQQPHVMIRRPEILEQSQFLREFSWLGDD